MIIRVMISGFGGQGVMAMGQILANAGLIEGKNVTWVPSYGPEMRGGTAHCCVTVANECISSPLGEDLNILIALSQTSLDKFLHQVKKEGIVLVNTQLVSTGTAQRDIKLYCVPADPIAKNSGNGRAANLVLLGAALALGQVADLVSVEKSMEKVWPGMDLSLLTRNRQALVAGYRWATLNKY